ncbi:MAG TPA: gamma-glutamyltransferase [Actinomycetaceae bacterium]|nr:gamma-glutamyltransferase [Actinomycetaceae bacterium]
MTHANRAPHPKGPLTGRPPARSERGMVSTPHALASVTGLHVLRRGGSAVDAAIAANAVLGVVYPHMAGLGGDAFALIQDDDGAVGLNASGPAGREATRYHYERLGLSEIPSRGPRAALTVPGAVDGWRAMHERFGRLDWAELFEDAIHHARTGVPVSRSLAAWLPRREALLSRDECAAALFLPGGEVPREGRPLHNPDLAESLEAIARLGAREGFYEGRLAEQLCVDGSPLRPADFAEYRASWVSPISATYRGVEVLEMPPNTQGFTALQMLGLIEAEDVAAWGDLSPDYLHFAAEAAKVAFADRDAWITDPEVLEIPVEHLISRDYLAGRRRLISRESSLAAHQIEPGVGRRPDRPAVPGGTDTCFLCAVDSDGMAVSLIQSIYHDFGAGVVAPGTGTLLQNRGSYFSLDESHHNRLAPGKRTFHTLIPAMLRRDDGTPYALLGAMGGEGQPQTHLALITRLIDFGYDVQQAIEAPRWLVGRTWGTASPDLCLEGRIPAEVAEELRRRGHEVRTLGDWQEEFGHAQAIRIHPDGFLEGGADPRGDGTALGY